MHTKRFIILISVSALLWFAGTGCKHTAQGVGKDMEKAGEKMQEKTE